MGEEGRILPPYGGIDTCRNEPCGQPLTEEQGAYLHTNRDTGKLLVLCGGCSRQAQMFDALRFPLVAL